MENNALISVRSIQQYEGNPPDTIELMTEGRIWEENGTLCFSYQETELTGLADTQTDFRVEDGAVILERKGTVGSRMEFRVGEVHKSLYDTAGLGSLLITVRTTEIENNLDVNGGNLRVSYSIEIEDNGLGTVTYDITITRR